MIVPFIKIFPSNALIWTVLFISTSVIKISVKSISIKLSVT